eukprot:GFYU01011679.1.p1 GENE.GFYU01011679.1~~GFYU01011679.1.p1  ORF type:complete len:228 (-),score=36.11 GFYU01011679.1:72-755(-)
MDDPTVREFQYVRIPYEDSVAVEQLKFKGTEQDFAQSLGEHFKVGQLTPSQMEAYKQHVLTQIPPGLSAEQKEMIMDSIMKNSPTHEIMPVIAHSKANGFIGTTFYGDDVSAFKQLPVNTRASHAASREIRGDVFMVKTMDNGTDFERLNVICRDFEVIHAKPPPLPKQPAQPQVVMKQSADKCTNCGKSAENLLRCAKCKNAFYCDRDCQKSDWKYHKRVCGNAVQ